MDIRRFAIIFGLAISTYFLILAWNDDYGQATVANAPIAQNTTIQVGDSPPASDIIAAGESSVDESDIPTIVPAILEPAIEVFENTQLIQIKTDVLNVTINPLGGEIVEVSLPAYPADIADKDIPFVLMENNARRVYVAQSGLLDSKGKQWEKTQAYSTSQVNYQLDDASDTLTVELSTQLNDVEVKKVFTFQRNNYLIDVQYQIANNSDAQWRGVFFAQLKRDRSEDPQQGSSMGMQAYLGPAITTNLSKYEKISFDDIDDKRLAKTVDGGWVAMLQHYFVAAWVANPDETHSVYAKPNKQGEYIVGFHNGKTPLEVAVGETGSVGAQLYVGPKTQYVLADVAENLDLTVDYGWLWWIAQPLFAIMNFIESGYINFLGMVEIDLGGGVGNWGVAIILLTVFIKLCFFKLSATSYRSMANMRKVAPKLAAIREQHADNKEKLGQEMMALYKKEKINPLGGCLPILVQMPVFIALYWVLAESVELRQAPFMLWINDLSAIDPYFVLPLLMGASMFVQMQLNPTPPDPVQARVMKLMPIIFTVFFLFFPSGLVLYWVVNNLLSITQQYVITKQIENADT
ncbi:MAG: YidC/Oxa1 family membrane protein insertase [Oleispira sp.]|jgi:YidC/Oxa1 family membrane protein insertase